MHGSILEPFLRAGVRTAADPAPESGVSSVGVALLSVAMTGVVLVSAACCFLSVRRRRRRRGVPAESELPTHLTRLERAVLPEAVADPESIRQMRQRRWTARHAGNGLSLEELDLVAPVRAYEPGRKGFRKDDASTAAVEGSVAAIVGSAGSEEIVEGSGGGSEKGEVNDDTCAVCLDDMCAGDKTRMLRCGHEFHGDCIAMWVTKENRCPVCSMEPLESAAIARRRNARSTTRRGIDAAIRQQRRRRTRGTNGVYELQDEDDAEPAAEDAGASTVDEVSTSASGTSIVHSVGPSGSVVIDLAMPPPLPAGV